MAAGGRRAVLGVEQPLVRTEGPVEPERVVEARHLEVAVEDRPAVVEQRGVEERHVRGIGQHAPMDVRVVGKRAGRPYPDLLGRIEPVATHVMAEVDGTQLDRPFALPVAADRLRLPFTVALASIDEPLDEWVADPPLYLDTLERACRERGIPVAR